MKPILYQSTETEFSTNGVGVLSDAISCIVTEERNGAYELELEYPMDGVHYADIVDRAVICAKPNPSARTQPFRVCRISKPMAGVVRVYAQHISYDLSGVVDEPFTAQNAPAAMAGLGNNAVGNNQFAFWTDKTTSATMTVMVPQSLRALLGGQQGSILDVYGGEYEFDRFTVKLYAARGANRGVSIRYGKNLIDLEQERSCAAVYTSVYPYWSSGDGVLVSLPEKTVDAPGTYDFSKIMTLDLSGEFTEQPSEAQLRAKALAYVTDNRIGVPTVSLTVEFAQLGQTTEYQELAGLEQVNLCDTVNVEFPKLGVSATAKVVKTVYDVIAERYASVEVGDARNNIADTVAAQQTEIKQKPSSAQVKTAIQTLTAAIIGANGGAARLIDTNGDGMPDTLYIADHPDPALANKVWRFNYEGWGASHNGYNGPFVMGATLDGGIVADFITAGTLTADLIKAGVLESINGATSINMATGNATLTGQLTSGADASGVSYELGAQGLKIKLNQNMIGEIFAYLFENGAPYVQAVVDSISLGHNTAGRTSWINGDSIQLMFESGKTFIVQWNAGGYGILSIDGKIYCDAFSMGGHTAGWLSFEDSGGNTFHVLGYYE